MIQRTRGSWLTVMLVLMFAPIGVAADGDRDLPADRQGGTTVIAAGRALQTVDATSKRVRVVDLRRRSQPIDVPEDGLVIADGWLDFDVQATPFPRVRVRDRRHDGSHYGGRPHFLRRYAPYGYGYLGGVDVLGVQRALEESYYAGRLDERQDTRLRFNRRDMARRKQRLLDKHQQALAAGLAKLKEGDYARAVVGLTLAAELNNGDPACRIHLAQARLALGQYQEAAKVLRRALELQPKLVYMDLKLDRYYLQEGKLAECADALAERVKQQRADADVYFLLGYVEFQRGRFDQAHKAFSRVARVRPKDSLTQTYLEIAQPPAE